MKLQKQHIALLFGVCILYIVLCVCILVYRPFGDANQELFNIFAFSYPVFVTVFFFVEIQLAKKNLKKRIHAAGYREVIDWDWTLSYPIAEKRDAAVIKSYRTVQHPQTTLVHYDVHGIHFIGCEYTVEENNVPVELYDRRYMPKNASDDDRLAFPEMYGDGQDRVELESVEFNDQFYVYAANEIDAYHFFDTDTMLDLLLVSRKLSVPIYIQVQNNSILISTTFRQLVHMLGDSYTVVDFVQNADAVFNTLDKKHRI